MFEFHAYKAPLNGERSPPPRPAPRASAPGDIAAMSFLFWSEHCVECAAPDCYATCSLYEARADGRCRRFAYGIFRNRRYPGLRGYGADISFRRWGKLKANGNTRMEPVAAVLRRERLLRLARPAMAFVGRIGQRLGWANLWVDSTRHLDKRARRLHRRAGSGSGSGFGRPDAFLIEVENPGEAIALEFEMRVSLDLVNPAEAAAAPPPFRASVHLPFGHSRHIIPHRAFAAVTDCGLPFKIALMPVGTTPRLIFLALDFVAWRERPAEAEPAIKCVVLDLDDTLWDGVLVEGGGRTLAEGVEQTLREFDRRGILLAIASRNDPEPVLKHLDRFGLRNLFVAIRVGWGSKSQAIADIAARLNLGLDAFAFIDDSAFERAEVAAALPAVTCFDARLLPSLPDDPRFRGGHSAVARNRRRLYVEAERREAARSASAHDVIAFLRSCRTRLEIAPFRPGDFERVVELAQRTNQLNASGSRYDRGACAALVARPSLCPLVLRCADVHGDYGAVGFAVVGEDRDGGEVRIRIEEFMLSCRLQGRRLEQAFFGFLAAAACDRAPASLWLNFRLTGRNGALAGVLDQLGFDPAEEGGRRLSLPAASLDADLVDIVDLVTGAGGGASMAAERRAVA